MTDKVFENQVENTVFFDYLPSLFIFGGKGYESLYHLFVLLLEKAVTDEPTKPDFQLLLERGKPIFIDLRHRVIFNHDILQLLMRNIDLVNAYLIGFRRNKRILLPQMYFLHNFFYPFGYIFLIPVIFLGHGEAFSQVNHFGVIILMNLLRSMQALSQSLNNFLIILILSAEIIIHRQYPLTMISLQLTKFLHKILFHLGQLLRFTMFCLLQLLSQGDYDRVVAFVGLQVVLLDDVDQLVQFLELSLLQLILFIFEMILDGLLYILNRFLYFLSVQNGLQIDGSHRALMFVG